MTKARPKTIARGVADGKALAKKAITAELRKWIWCSSYTDIASFAQNLRERIDEMAKNADKRPGGQGKK